MKQRGRLIFDRRINELSYDLAVNAHRAAPRDMTERLPDRKMCAATRHFSVW